ncbi:fungal-specific transcription factor domain-containing protein [Xylariales sp. PMI_506]|nr:fungal-specific transcription factor domain-containing protein [Xylariales sp. PMI_506]
MSGKRSRQGCEECRRRRRKCDEQKPSCGQCSASDRDCKYTLKLVWGGRKFARSRFGQCLQHTGESPAKIDSESGGFVYGVHGITSHHDSTFESAFAFRLLPNGVPVPRKYQKLLNYFAENTLASLSCHPSIHADLRQGLIPAMLHSPHLLSACLSLSAAGLISRGISHVDGIDIFKILGHLRTSGMALLRTALVDGQTTGTLLATCLVWSLTDVFACRQEMLSSWRVHLQGVKAIMDDTQDAYRNRILDTAVTPAAMRHLYLLYLSLQTLPHIKSPDLRDSTVVTSTHAVLRSNKVWVSVSSSTSATTNIRIDGFLGYSEELLHMLYEVNQLSQSPAGESDMQNTESEADIILGKIMGMVVRDAKAPPDVSICSSLSPEYGREFSLCHRTFQQAALIYVYRRLYKMPSNSELIQAAVQAITDMVNNMTQGQPCHTWVAMAMPLFTIGCEAFMDSQKSFVLDKIHKLDVCLGSLHVGVIRQALEDMWRMRAELGDFEGKLCATRLLSELKYNIILF